MRFVKLRQKEVINVCDGKSLGFICDLLLDCCGCIEAIVVPGCSGVFNFFKNNEYVIPWKCIDKIGDDVILVTVDLSTCSVRR